MLDYGRSTSLPAPYRIALAISLALFLHTLGLSAIPLLPEPTEQPAPTMTVLLVPPGSRATPKTIAGPEDTEIRADAPAAAKATATSRQTPPRTRPEPAPSASPPSDETVPAAETARKSAPSPSTTAGIPSDSPAPQSRSDIVQLTEAPGETDAYVIRLAARIARELKRSRLPALRTLTAPVAMEIELHLMGNGALTRANVYRSSGMEAIDGAAYRAALAASPYPEPPGREEGQRYRVELLFSPERLEN